jgi:undecaprenyl diphosphate synthase
MRLFRRYLVTEAERCASNGVRIHVIGRRDRLSPRLVETIETAEATTAGAGPFRLRIAVDYSARDTILRAASRLGRLGRPEDLSREAFARFLAEPPDEAGPVPDVDLLIRTGGEKRLSDFLLWECAYAELVFTDRMWPDFGAADLAEALREFHARERRFGKVTPVAAAPTPMQRETRRAGLAG